MQLVKLKPENICQKLITNIGKHMVGVDIFANVDTSKTQLKSNVRLDYKA